MTPAEQAWADSPRTDTRCRYAWIAGWNAGRAAGLREALEAEPEVPRNQRPELFAAKMNVLDEWRERIAALTKETP